MKKVLLSCLLVAGTLAANAQQLAQEPNRFCDNWYIGVEGGMTSPLNNGKFFKDARGIFGINVKKQLTPVFGVGVEGSWGVNTSSWKNNLPKSNNGIDQQYVGLYGSVNLMKLFGGVQYNGIFDMEVVGGAGWGLDYYPKADDNGHGSKGDWNYFATQAGLNFNFHVSDRVTLSLKPSVRFDMSDAGVNHTSAAYNANKGQLNIQAGVNVRLGKGFTYVPAYDAAEVAALNAQINDLRAANLAAEAANVDLMATNAALAAQLDACLNRPTAVVKEVKTDLSTVRYVNFQIGKTNITADQMPNVAAVANYLKNHPASTVVIDGYASKDGPEEVNIRLANQRAQSVKDCLINKYGIKADRIKAQGKGIGEMFDEESWNRVAICTVDQN